METTTQNDTILNMDTLMDNHTTISNDPATPDTPHSNMDFNTELWTIRINRRREKIARFRSHKNFLTKCLEENIIPQNFRIILSLSIGNHDNTFSARCLDKTHNLSRELMKDTITFCDNTISQETSEIHKMEATLKGNTNHEEFSNILSTLNNHIDQVSISLDRIKRDKFDKLRKYTDKHIKPHNPDTSTSKRQNPRTPTPPRHTNHRQHIPRMNYRPPYANPLLNKSQIPHMNATTHTANLQPFLQRYGNPTPPPIPRPTLRLDSTNHNATPHNNHFYPHPIHHFPKQNHFGPPKNDIDPRPTHLEGGNQNLLHNATNCLNLLNLALKGLLHQNMTQMAR